MAFHKNPVTKPHHGVSRTVLVQQTAQRLFKSPQNPVTQPLCGARVDFERKQENMNI